MAKKGTVSNKREVFENAKNGFFSVTSDVQALSLWKFKRCWVIEYSEHWRRKILLLGDICGLPTVFSTFYKTHYNFSYVTLLFKIFWPSIFNVLTTNTSKFRPWRSCSLGKKCGLPKTLIKMIKTNFLNNFNCISQALMKISEVMDNLI